MPIDDIKGDSIDENVEISDFEDVDPTLMYAEGEMYNLVQQTLDTKDAANDVIVGVPLEKSLPKNVHVMHSEAKGEDGLLIGKLVEDSSEAIKPAERVPRNGIVGQGGNAKLATRKEPSVWRKLLNRLGFKKF